MLKIASLGDALLEPNWAPRAPKGASGGVRQVSKNAESYVKYVSKRMFLICLEKRVETHPSKNTVFYVSKRPFGLPVGVS